MMSTPGGPPVLTPMLVRTPTDASPMMKPHPSTATLPPEFHPPVFGVGGSPQLPNPLTPQPSPLCPPPLTDGVQPAAHHTPRTVSPSHQPAPFTPVSHPFTLSPLQLAGLDPHPQHPISHAPYTFTAHQLKDVPTFAGLASEKHGLKVEDWARDMMYLLEAKGPQPDHMQFREVVRHTRGKARDAVLNLERRGGATAKMAIAELVEEFGEGVATITPIATFFARRQRPEESPTDYAIALEALLRRMEDMEQRQGRQVFLGEDRDQLLTSQFMTGLHDCEVRQRLAPMRPRTMSFKMLRQELRIFSEESSLRIDRRRQQRIFVQQQGTSTEPAGRPAAADTAAPTTSAKPTSNSMTADDKLSELTTLVRRQLAALNDVMHGQQYLGQRVQQIEGYLGQGPRPNQPQIPPQESPRDQLRREGRCFVCRECGHIARQCPRRQPQRPQAASDQMPASPLN